MRAWIIKHSKRMAWLGWLTVCVVMIIKLILQGKERSVYPLFLCGGSHWLDSLSVYTGECMNFQYWPGFAAFMSPFSLLPHMVGSYLWSMLNISVLIIGASLFLKTFLINDTKKYFWVALLLAVPMSLDGILNQQSNPLLAGLVLLGAGFAGRKRWWLACLFLLLPGLIKVAPMCFALLVLAVYPKQLWWRMLIVGILLLLLPFGLQTYSYVISQYREWFGVLSGEAGERWAYRDAYVLYELLTMGHVSNHEKVGDMGWFRFLQLAAAGGAFCCTVIASYVRKKDLAFCGGLAIACGGWWLIMFGPSTEVATCVMATGAAAWSIVIACKHKLFILMLCAFVLLCVGSNGEIEYELGRALGDWNKGFLSLGALLWGIWLFYISIINNDKCFSKEF